MSFAEGFSVGQQWRERQDQKKEQEKNRAREFKALVEYGDASGTLSKDKAMAMDLDSLRGYHEGIAAKAAALKTKQANDAVGEIGPALAYLMKQTAPTTTGEDWGNYLEKTRTEPGGDRVYPTGPPAMDPDNATAEMLSRYPNAASSPQFDNVFKLLQYGQQRRGETPEKVVQGRTAAGTPYVTFGKQFNFDPTATAETRQRNAVDLLDKKNAPVDPGEPPDAEAPAGYDWGWNGKRWTHVRLPASGDVTQKDEFNALQAEKRSLINAKAKGSSSMQSGYDSMIKALDDKIAGLQSAKPKGQGAAPAAPDAGAADQSDPLGLFK